jgi:hypothetical protein
MPNDQLPSMKSETIDREISEFSAPFVFDILSCSNYCHFSAYFQ